MKYPYFLGLFLIAATLSSARSAHADDAFVFLPGPARAISRATSASRDTPVLEYAFGPRAQASLGVEPGVLELPGRRTTWRFGFYSLVALENANSTDLFPPTELWRELVGVSMAVELKSLARAWLVPGSALEVGLVFGHEGDHAGADVSLPALGPHDIAFGGGGNFIAPDVAIRLPVGRAVTLTMRLADRIYWNELPSIVGARAASDVIADDLHEGLENAASADLIARWHATKWAAPQLALFGEHLFSHDEFADDGGFFRAMLSVVFPGKIGELSPFYSFDAGNGKGLLVVRRELRSSLGIRYAFF
jgi:hypothetical protein